MLIFLLIQFVISCPTKEEMSVATYTGKCLYPEWKCCYIETENTMRPITLDSVPTEYLCCYGRTRNGTNKCCNSYTKTREMTDSETLGLVLFMIIVFPLIAALGPRDDDW